MFTLGVVVRRVAASVCRLVGVVNGENGVGVDESVKLLEPVGGIGAGLGSAIREGRAVGCKVEPWERRR